MNKLRRILWADDDAGYTALFVEHIRDLGYEVDVAHNVEDALDLASKTDYELAILDVELPPAEGHKLTEKSGGTRKGLALARDIRSRVPNLRILGHSAHDSNEIREWFQTYGVGFVAKLTLQRKKELLRRIGDILDARKREIRSLIVHGHDDVAKWELKNYLQSRLNLAEPTILHEKPSSGRSILEKFEHHSEDVDVVFVLLTPDDRLLQKGDSGATVFRARQNVIFEMGFFLGALGRKRGRVLLLHKGPLDLPSDIAGLIYIDIGNGIESAGELIRVELENLGLSQR